MMEAGYIVINLLVLYRDMADLSEGDPENEKYGIQKECKEVEDDDEEEEEEEEEDPYEVKLEEEEQEEEELISRHGVYLKQGISEIFPQISDDTMNTIVLDRRNRNDLHMCIEHLSNNKETQDIEIM
ncbi:hypothetical protein KP79_PYT05811 [Mizuhopecten yessoensis]|uniref:Uncharacterized protein n=1 Tax=Mizuhopecten yessoensis TaxID=6573 RepID=A0A210Q6Y9_MIZYE|nr:hypothetical protein KP79_PYT05811 [Mizuhopecten yessoensis]